MESILTFNQVTKRYGAFSLDKISFQLPRGMILGVIGENGAGKTTMIQAAMDLVRPEEGEIRVFGLEHGSNTREIKERAFAVLDGLNQNPFLQCGDLDKMMGRIYRRWDSRLFWDCLERFELPAGQKIRKLSKGMNAKLNLAAAFAARPELLLLDEATAGLDPVMREEILDMLLEFVMEGQNSVLLSSHITNDLDKIADYILFLHQGKRLFFKSKEELERFGVLHCGKEFFQALAQEDYEAWRKESYEYRVLVKDRYELAAHFRDAVVEKATVEDLMLFYLKGVRP